MAVSPSSPESQETKPDISDTEKPVLQSNQQQQQQQPDPSLFPPPPPSSSSSSTQPLPSTPPSSSSTQVIENPNSNSPIVPPIAPQSSFAPPAISPGTLPPSAPSFRPVTTPIPMSTTPQFSPVPNQNMQNPNFQNPTVQPPGVSPVPIMVPGVAPVTPLRPGVMYQPVPGQPPHPAARPYGQIPNGYSAMPPPAPQGMIPPPGIPRYPSPYPSMGRPMFPPRPPGTIGMLPPLSRPPVPGIRGVSPVIPPVARPLLPIVTPTEKPQTTVYVGKIAPTVENDFMLSLLRLCGPVKSWKHAQVPSDGTSKGFGFCEFESAEGVLRALRLLSKFNVDGQELVLNVNQATRDYLERYVEKKTEREKLKETEGTDKEDETAPGVEKKEPSKSTVEDSNKDANGSMDSESQDNPQNFGIVNDEDRENDRDALEKLTNMLEERLKTKPLPPPPPRPPADASGKPNSEVPSKSRDMDSDADIVKSDGDKNDEETTSENKHINEQDRTETSSPDRNRRHDRRSKDKDRERDLKREKERELERYERERERERVRRERERETKIREAERRYKESVKEWESREREKEYQRQHEREREKERERERKREIIDQEDESDDDDTRKRRRRSSVLEEKRKKRQREKEEDKADRLREEEEIVEAKRRAIEEQLQQRNEPKPVVSDQIKFDQEKPSLPEESSAEGKDDIVEQTESDSVPDNHAGDVVMRNGIGDETTVSSVAVSDVRQSSNAPARKLGFGLVGSGKRTTVPSVFHEEDDDDATKDSKMRPLVPIDYSTEEIQAVHSSVSETTPPNLAAAAEFAKRISGVNPKEERSEGERERNRRSGDRSNHRDRDRDRHDEESNRSRDDNREKNHDRDRDREHGLDKLKTSENKKLLDAKQLIDMIPKTKEELFSYEINWAVYDKHDLHERMRPWISKKITEFLGEEETTLVEYIVSSTKEHVRALQMLDLLQPILDDEAEMFVLKMWRMLIFEIKKVETGLSLKNRT